MSARLTTLAPVAAPAPVTTPALVTTVARVTTPAQVTTPARSEGLKHYTVLIPTSPHVTGSDGDNTEVEDGDASCEKTQDMPQTMRAPQTSLRKTSVMEDVEEHDSDEEQADQSMDENKNSEPSPE
ncbi:hypothetical protein GN958_ATG18888 [Phytophthora infestans]|uniref:Uncharacterized protein n=1 Tax=Phytophthora infestans TaxID=4787 RepID=A0A8S9TSM5_PHYIN|nr:hypothetical protein GN958_ATG18888 [Phytophthora infestans]